MGTSAPDRAGGPTGEAVLAMLLRLFDGLRQAGVDVAMVEVLDAAEALRHLDLGDRPTVRLALQATLIKRAEDEAVFHALFDRCFPRRPPDVGDGAPSEAEPGEGATAAVPAPAAEGVEPSVDRADTRADLLEALLTALRDGDDEALEAIAARAVSSYSGIGEMAASERYFLYRVLRALDLAGLLSRAMRAERAEEPDASELALRLRRDELARRIEHFRRLLAQELRQRRLPGTEADVGIVRLEDRDVLGASTLDLWAMRQAVRPLARQLAARVAQRRRRHRAGRLDVRRTIRRSLSSGGTPIDPAFRRRRTSKPDVVVLCDLSGSVAEFASFTLALVHALHAELARLRTFVFVDGVAEVTSVLDTVGDEVAALDLLRRPGVVAGDGHSDYGQVFQRFWDHHAGAVVSPSTTVIVTGDARANYRPAGLEPFRQLCQRARRVYWLNPEPREAWDTLDSTMAAYASTCTKVFEVRNLRQLGEAIAEIV